jgi:hypothetical protein
MPGHGQTGSRSGTGSGMMGKGAPTEGDVDGLAEKLETDILTCLDKATAVK